MNKYLDYLTSLSPVIVGAMSTVGDSPILVPTGAGIGGSSAVTYVGDQTRLSNKRLPGTPALQMFGGCARVSNVGNLGTLTTGFTVAAYVRAARFGTAGWDRIISFGTAFINNEVIFSRSSITNQLNLSFWNGTTSTPNAAVTSPSNTLLINNYYHVAGVYERASNQMRLYIGGALVATATGITSMANASTRTNAAFSGPTSGTGAEYWNGANFLPAIFDKVLTPSEIATLAQLATSSRALSGNAKYTDTGLGVSRVVGIHRPSGETVFTATPASNGDWSAEVGADDVHIAYLGETEYAPQVHGPY